MEQLILHKNQLTGECNKRVILLKKTRWIIWFILVLLTFNCAIVNGILATSGQKVQADKHMMSLEYSTFLAFYYVGRFIGIFFLYFVIDVANRKYLFIYTAIQKALAIFLFTYSPSFSLSMISRLLTGMSNAMSSGLVGIWVQQYCSPSYSCFMSALISFGTPMGRSFGIMYEMYFGGPKNWRNGMRLNSGMLAFCGFALMFFPNIYFSTKLVKADGKDSKFRPSQQENYSLFNIRQSQSGERDIAFCQKVKILFSNGIFFFTVFCRASIAMINASFIFGMPGFISNNFKNSPKELRTWIYSLSIITGPYIGSFIGGILVKKAGGYSSKMSYIIVLILDIFVGCAIIPMIYVENWRMFMLNLYLYFIFSSSVLPHVVGIMKTSLPVAIRQKGLAFATVLNFCFGPFLGPYMFGTVNANYAPVDKRFVMKFMTCYAFAGAGAMLLATIIKCIKGSDEQEKKNSTPVAPANADVLDNEEQKGINVIDLSKKVDEQKQVEDDEFNTKIPLK